MLCETSSRVNPGEVDPLPGAGPATAERPLREETLPLAARGIAGATRGNLSRRLPGECLSPAPRGRGRSARKLSGQIPGEAGPFRGAVTLKQSDGQREETCSSERADIPGIYPGRCHAERPLPRGADFVIFALESSGAALTRLFPGISGRSGLSEKPPWVGAHARQPSAEVPSCSAGYAPAAHLR